MRLPPMQLGKCWTVNIIFRICISLCISCILDVYDKPLDKGWCDTNECHYPGRGYLRVFTSRRIYKISALLWFSPKNIRDISIFLVFTQGFSKQKICFRALTSLSTNFSVSDFFRFMKAGCTL